MVKLNTKRGRPSGPETVKVGVRLSLAVIEWIDNRRSVENLSRAGMVKAMIDRYLNLPVGSINGMDIPAGSVKIVEVLR